MGTTKENAHTFYVDPSDYKSTFATSLKQGLSSLDYMGGGDYTLPMRVIWTNKSVPSWAPVTGSYDSWGLMQVPYFSYISGLDSVE